MVGQNEEKTNLKILASVISTFNVYIILHVVVKYNQL